LEVVREVIVDAFDFEHAADDLLRVDLHLARREDGARQDETAAAAEQMDALFDGFGLAAEFEREIGRLDWLPLKPPRR
jgi:hypothetical protein